MRDILGLLAFLFMVFVIADYSETVKYSALPEQVKIEMYEAQKAEEQLEIDNELARAESIKSLHELSFFDVDANKKVDWVESFFTYSSWGKPVMVFLIVLLFPAFFMPLYRLDR